MKITSFSHVCMKKKYIYICIHLCITLIQVLNKYTFLRCNKNNGITYGERMKSIRSSIRVVILRSLLLLIQKSATRFLDDIISCTDLGGGIVSVLLKDQSSNQGTPRYFGMNFCLSIVPLRCIFGCWYAHLLLRWKQVDLVLNGLRVSGKLRSYSLRRRISLLRICSVELIVILFIARVISTSSI